MLDDRAKLLLKALVERYIADGQPVGSRTLSRASGLDLSPATIRNVMADLEELGLIASPHTSAGRVPTARGYRLFVDTMLTVQREAVMPAQLAPEQPQKVIANAAQLLSNLSQFVGVVMAPRRTSVFRHIEFLRLSEKRFLVIIVTPDGERIAQFLSVSMKAHDVAFIKHAEKGKFHHASFYLDTWQDVLMAADLISMTDTSLDIGPTRHGLTQGQTIYFFDPSGNRNEVFAGGGYRYQDHPVITWDAQELGKAIFYHDRQLNERFLSVLT